MREQRFFAVRPDVPKIIGNGYAKATIQIINNSVGGSGIWAQMQVKIGGGKLLIKVNDAIESAWENWCDKDTCDPAGKLWFQDMERPIMGAIVENGEVFVYHAAYRQRCWT